MDLRFAQRGISDDVNMTRKSHPLRPVRGREGFCDFDKMDVYQSNDLVYVRGLRRRGQGLEEAEYLCITRQAGHVNSRPLIYATDRDIRDSSDKRLASDIQAVVGLIQLLQGYYLVVVSEARPVGWIGGRGCHQVWSTEKTVLLPLKAASSSDQQQQQSAAAAAVVGSSTSGSGGSILHQRQLAKDERRLIDLIQDMQASRGYYYCHTYDISQSAQSNLAESLLSRFVWNWTHSEGFRDNPDQRVRQWYVPIIYGYFAAREISALSRVLSIILISRRSRFYAGTRYRKRGINADGDAANEVETEQILIDLSTGGMGRQPFSSFVQVRGSAPVFWMQDQSQLSLVKPKPPIRFQRTDRNNTASRRHFSGLLGRYGAPVLVINLMRHAEGEVVEEGEEEKPSEEGQRSLSTVENEQEFLLGSHYQKMVNALNADLPSAVKIRYVVFDLKAYSKHLVAQARLRRGGQDLVDHLGILSEWLALSTGWLHIHANGEVKRFQSGVARSSCVDCLDRTNVFQYHIGCAALCSQLREQGLIGVPEAGEPPPLMVMRELTRMYEEMGDQLAWQYAGSEAHKKYANIMGAGQSLEGHASSSGSLGGHRRVMPRGSGDTDWVALSAPSRELLISLHRHYANSVSDQEKQHAVNLFLGLYSPVRALPRPWQTDCDVDAFVHHQPLGDDPMDSHTDWWTDPLRAFKMAASRSFAQVLPEHIPSWFGLAPEDSDEGCEEVEEAQSSFEQAYPSTTLTRFNTLQPPLGSCAFLDVVPRGAAVGVRREENDGVRTEKDILDPATLHSIKLTPLQVGVTANDQQCEGELLQAATRIDSANQRAREVEEVLLSWRSDEDPCGGVCHDRQAYSEYCDLGRLSRMVNAVLLSDLGSAKEALAEYWCMDEDVGRALVMPRRKVSERGSDARALLNGVIAKEVAVRGTFAD
ncbi:hypothetical protein FOZ60_011319 [Perkinsus olseni]|uniref:SAC domain-containing protein n=1 Tax=Perkinsus olseni TaxID=32597 RepID=A0A7J6PB30_PEROL|nr:hypothetical protein FOZ60_011319 [Perkinsus olseni]